MIGRTGERPRNLLVAFPFVPVSRDAAGGAEQILSILESNLYAQGMDAAVAAHRESVAAGKLFGTGVPDGTVTGELRELVPRRHRESVRKADDVFRPHIVHMHGPDFLSCFPDIDLPVLASFHLPPSWYRPEIFRLSRRKMRLVFVSKSQAASRPPCDYLLPPVENCVPVERLLSSPSKERYALGLGSVCPEKNFHETLEPEWTAFWKSCRTATPFQSPGRLIPWWLHVGTVQIPMGRLRSADLHDFLRERRTEW